MNSLKNDYQKTYTFKERNEEAIRILKKYPNKIPIIVQKKDNSLPDLDKKKFLVPLDFTIAQFILTLRKRISLDPSVTMIIFINNKIMSCSELLSSIYINEKNKDGFLYIDYTGENTFG